MDAAVRSKTTAERPSAEQADTLPPTEAVLQLHSMKCEWRLARL